MDKRDGINDDAVLQHMHTAVVSRLSASLGESQAHAVADAIVADIALQFGGQQIYFQRRSPYIARMIAERFTGDNVAELVARFHLSRSAIYKILQRERDKKDKLEQCRLPGC